MVVVQGLQPLSDMADEAAKATSLEVIRPFLEQPNLETSPGRLEGVPIDCKRLRGLPFTVET